MALFAAAGARIQKVRRGRPQIEIEALVGVGGKKAHSFILEDKIADAIEDRFLLVNFNAHGKVRAVADKNIRARVDCLMSKVREKVRSLLQLSAGPGS